jgi:hypothetical protein
VKSKVNSSVATDIENRQPAVQASSTIDAGAVMMGIQNEK